MGEWVNDQYYYMAHDIDLILGFGRSSDAKDREDGICERVDVEMSMKALSIKRHLYWDANNYQAIADYLNGGANESLCLGR